MVCIELWLRFEPQIRSTIFAMNFLFIIATTYRKVRFCVKLFDHFLTEYSSVLAEIFRVSFQILLGFFHKISTRNSFWKMFQKILALQGAPLSYVVCIQLRRHVDGNRPASKLSAKKIHED